MKTIVISRRWVEIPTFRSVRQCWTYDYAFNGGSPPAVQIEYGPAVSRLREVLRRHFPDHKIVNAWEVRP